MKTLTVSRDALALGVVRVTMVSALDTAFAELSEDDRVRGSE
jgi:hypothetical protein